jgi:hypothetical protein
MCNAHPLTFVELLGAFGAFAAVVPAGVAVINESKYIRITKG